jgi:hypothetical protein
MVPKKIYQTYKSYKLSDNQKKCIHRILQFNPEFEYTFMDDKECLTFIEDNFEEDIVNMYKNLPLGIMRADVWRIAVIYINGGVYCDTDVSCNSSLIPLIENQELVLFNEETGGTSNFFFAAKPKHPALKDALDAMVKRQNLAFDTQSDWLVQNFGMNLFHEAVVNVPNKRLLNYEESRQWVYHLWYNTWKDTEVTYKDLSNSTKPVTFFTTFNKSGYELYGKSWIDSFIQNVASTRNNIKAIVYAHGISNLTSNHPQVEIVDYDTTFPEHKIWKEKFLNKSNHPSRVKDFTIRFSHKGFVIQHALSNLKKGYGIWADGDVVFKQEDYSSFPNSLFQNNEVLACQIEDGNHVESGLIIFDLEHPDMPKFLKAYKHNYSLDEVLNNYGEPYDGFVARRALIHSEVEYIDLNKLTGNRGIQSDPNETFQHPEIKKRFIHNIGLTGKRSYSSWDVVKSKDKIFSILEDLNLPPIRKEIWKLRNKRYKSA